MIRFELKHPRARQDMLGLIPLFLDEHDPSPASEQFDKNYSHGGGWSPFGGFEMTEKTLEYPDDQPSQLLAEGKLRDEVIRVYEHAWVAIVQPDGSYEVSRMD